MNTKAHSNTDRSENEDAFGLAFCLMMTALVLAVGAGVWVGWF